MPRLLSDYARFLVSHPLWWILPPLLVIAAMAASIWFLTPIGVAELVYRL